MSNQGKTGLKRWKTDEWDKVVARAAELKAQNPTWKEGDLLQEAQKVLPPDRHRERQVNMHTVRSTNAWANAWARLNATRPVAAPVVAAPVASPPAEIPTERPQITTPAPARKGLSILDILSGHIAESISMALKRTLTDPEVVEGFKNAILDAMTSPPPSTAGMVAPAPTPAPTAAPAVPEVLRPRVAMYGLLPIQAESIKKEFPDMDFKFYLSDDKHDRMTQGAQWAHYALVMTDFFSHAAENAVRRGQCPDYRRVAGGPSAALRILHAVRADWKATH